MTAVLGLLFLLSAAVFPWWVTVLLALPLAPQQYGFVFLVAGGVIMDAAFGAPVPSLGGFSYIYTTLFVILSIVAAVLRARAMH